MLLRDPGLWEAAALARPAAGEKKPYVGSQEVCEELTVPMTFILDFIDG
jgi:hypothetical protein